MGDAFQLHWRDFGTEHAFGKFFLNVNTFAKMAMRQGS
jgi:hypothetical protein